MCIKYTFSASHGHHFENLIIISRLDPRNKFIFTHPDPRKYSGPFVTPT